ncbi:peptidoglycan DD-metalloendopeptidase family protein [Fulvivirga ulvae]|uniref:peptidoglycan DD-metalloendopeptidase family protein n=1 Tax=Fulvivirga ulvae TaxID=2904245 RepID=UPI001F22A1BF|nr:peptidoglycan DD-metalloendopeptidase family protein [Fulvivirga ulvae]UII34100.1 peptidoglycan DD-metalloendopeptidase family protein [Fulvivirga ulvae]
MIVLCTLILLSCNGFKKVKDVFSGNTPYEEYKKLLEKTELQKTALARQWLRAGKEAFQDSLSVSLPHTEAGYFQASRPDAHAYRFRIKSGQKLTVALEAVRNGEATLFVDLFENSTNGQWEQVAHGDSGNNLEYEFKAGRSCLLRIQPELLVDFYYTLTISVSPILKNPVTGATNLSIQSIFGDPRDGGLRSHEGIDIFARRGTPVIAPANGVIVRVGNTNLGGNVIWMKDIKRNLNYYFAHLDSQLVNSGKMVKTGDTLGLVGNTGNAKYTAPHLHFGIYQQGAINPLGFVQTMEKSLEKTPIDTVTFRKPYKVIAQKVNLRKGPGMQYGVQSELYQNNFLLITGESNSWYRAQLPDKQEGYIYKNLTEPITGGPEITLRRTVEIFSAPDSTSVPRARLTPPDNLKLLARYNGFEYIVTSENITGWISTGFVNTQRAVKR